MVFSDDDLLMFEERTVDDDPFLCELVGGYREMRDTVRRQEARIATLIQDRERLHAGWHELAEHAQESDRNRLALGALLREAFEWMNDNVPALMRPETERQMEDGTMGFYNIIFGVNPNAGVLLGALGLTREAVGRFRDAWVTENGQEIAIYTRNGGGNREQYMPDFSAHPLYLRDADDAFDSTYATILFRVPEAFAEAARSMAQARNPDKEWPAMIEALKTPGANPDVEARLTPLMDRLKKVLGTKE